MRSTYNPLFKNIKELKIYLEDNFYITNFCQSKSMRHSNLVLNTIFDKIENGLVKISKSNKKINGQDFQNFFKIKKEIQTFFQDSTQKDINRLAKEVLSDQILSTFCSKLDTSKLFQSFSDTKDLNKFYDQISEYIQTEGKYYALTVITSQIKSLFKLHQSFIIDAVENYDSDEQIISKLTQKYNFREIIDKNSELYKFEDIDWRKNTQSKQIKSLEKLTGIKRQQSHSDSQSEEINEKSQENLKDVFKEQTKAKDMELKLMHKTIQILKKDLYQINLQQKQEKHNLINEDKIAIFNHLNGQHRKNERLTASMKLNMNNIASTLKIEELETPVRNSFRSSRMSRKKMESKTESPMASQQELPQLNLKNKRKTLPRKVLKKLVEVEDFKSKYFIKLSKQPQYSQEWGQQGIILKTEKEQGSMKQSTNNSTTQLIRSVYGKEQMERALVQFRKPYAKGQQSRKNGSEELMRLLDESIEQRREHGSRRYMNVG